VGDVAGDEENVSGTERLLFTANREDRTAFENDAHLLVRVGMNFDDGVRLQARNRDHELFGCTGLDADAGEDGVVTAFIGSWKVATHGLGTLTVVKANLVATVRPPPTRSASEGS
jgi:hypothetical protein